MRIRVASAGGQIGSAVAGDTLMDGIVQDWRALVDSPVPEAVPA
jgi:hypothetical protein